MIINNIKDHIIGQLADGMVHTVSLQNSMCDFDKGLRMIFANVTEETRSIPAKEMLEFSAASFDVSRIPVSVVFYKGVPIWIKGTSTDTNNGNSNRNYCTLNTINTKHAIRVLHEFMNKLYKLNNRLSRKLWGETTHIYGGQSCTGIKYRTFNDIFITADVKEKIIASLDNFIKKEHWYEEHSIPYHFGILLYGPPGTGKSSLAQAICKYIGSNTTIVSGDDIYTLAEVTRTMPYKTPWCGLRTILCEDIDCGLNDKKRMFDLFKVETQDHDGKPDDDDLQEKRAGLGFSSLLNAIDGLGAPSGVVYIFTTNDISAIDKALLRPGRLDLKIEIGYVTREQFDEFTMKYFDKVSPEDFEIKDGIGFADIQNEMLKDASFDNIVKFVRKE